MAPKKRKAAAASTPKKASAAKKQKEESEERSSDSSSSGEDDQPTAESASLSSILNGQVFECEARTRDDEARQWNFKISSWNVSGVRAWLKKGGLAWVEIEQPDIFTLQETKCAEDQLPPEVKDVPGYYSYWSRQGSKSGYAGVGLFSKIKPDNVQYGIGLEKHDDEGRLLTAEYENFYLVAVYVPNSSRGLVRLPYRREWNEDLLDYLRRLDQVKPVILAGDLNVAHHPIDLARPKSNTKSAGFTKEERDDFTTLLKAGFVDAFRHLYPDEKDAYTFWSYMGNARGKNVGWRLDYFLLSQRLAPDLCDCVMRSKVTGSDHCPITLFMAFKW